MNFLIESIRKINKKPRCKVTLDNGDFFVLSIDIVVRYRLSKGFMLDQNSLDNLIAEQKLIDCKQVGFNYASYKPRTSKQVIGKLKFLGFLPAQISPTIDFLVKFDLLDDYRFSTNYIDNKLRKKSIGINKIRIELLRKGIPKDVIESAIQQKYPYHLAFELALAAANKKMIQIKRMDEKKQKPALLKFLNSQGFDWDTVRAVAREIFRKF